jgi:hypothetical protein
VVAGGGERRDLLLATEIGMASVMVLLFNLPDRVGQSAKVAMAKLIILAYARNDRGNWLSRRRERTGQHLSAARDACTR